MACYIGILDTNNHLYKYMSTTYIRTTVIYIAPTQHYVWHCVCVSIISITKYVLDFVTFADVIKIVKAEKCALSIQQSFDYFFNWSIQILCK